MIDYSRYAGAFEWKVDLLPGDPAGASAGLRESESQGWRPLGPPSVVPMQDTSILSSHTRVMPGLLFVFVRCRDAQ